MYYFLCIYYTIKQSIFQYPRQKILWIFRINFRSRPAALTSKCNGNKLIYIDNTSNSCPHHHCGSIKLLIFFRQKFCARFRYGAHFTISRRTPRNAKPRRDLWQDPTLTANSKTRVRSRAPPPRFETHLRRFPIAKSTACRPQKEQKNTMSEKTLPHNFRTSSPYQSLM